MLGFNERLNCRSQFSALGPRGNKQKKKQTNNRNKLLFSGEVANSSSRAKQATPCESQPLSTLDSDELQLCDEQFTCHPEIQAQLLPMKQIMGNKTNLAIESNHYISPIKQHCYCCTCAID